MTTTERPIYSATDIAKMCDPNAKQVGKRWQARCPAHDDKRASLSVGNGDCGRVLIHCHAGCTPGAICDAINITLAELCPKEIKQKRTRLVQHKAKNPASGVKSGDSTTIRDYYFCDRDGTPLYLERRTDTVVGGSRTKTTIPYKVERHADGSVAYAADGQIAISPNLEGVEKRVIYNWPAVIAAIENSIPVFFVEGPKCAEALIGLGLVATTIIGGAAGYKPEHYNEAFRSAIVYILPDHDMPGDRLAHQVYSEINGIATEVKIVQIDRLKWAGRKIQVKDDIYDYLEQGGDIGELLELAINTNDKICVLPASATHYDIAQAVIDYIAPGMLRRYNGQWLVYDNDKHVWVFDEDKAIAAVTALIPLYNADTHLAEDVKTKILAKLKNASFCKSVLEFLASEDKIRINAEKLDAVPRSINLVNGLLGFDAFELVTHRPDHYTTKIANCSYDPQARAPRWQGFIENLFPDKEIRDYVQRAVGYSLFGNPTERVMFLLNGPSGSGKSTFVNAVAAILGDYGVRQANNGLVMRTSTPDRREIWLTEVKGARLITLAEIDRNMPIDEAALKALISTDSVRVRRLYQMPETVNLSGVYWLPINEPPRSDISAATGVRIALINCGSQKPVKPDHGLLRHFTDNEASGILNWMLRGLVNYYKDGLNPPDAVAVAKRTWTDSNILAEFIADECVLSSECRSVTADLLEAYNKYRNKNGHNIIASNGLMAALRNYSENRKLQDSSFTVIESKASNGKRYYFGIGLRHEDS